MIKPKTQENYLLYIISSMKIVTSIATNTLYLFLIKKKNLILA